MNKKLELLARNPYVKTEVVYQSETHTIVRAFLERWVKTTTLQAVEDDPILPGVPCFEIKTELVTAAESLGIAQKSEIDVFMGQRGIDIATGKALRSLYLKLFPGDETIERHVYKRL